MRFIHRVLNPVVSDEQRKPILCGACSTPAFDPIDIDQCPGQLENNID